ncbi:MAG: peptidase domain-containing ABC transporter [Nannocystales bacterium]
MNSPTQFSSRITTRLADALAKGKRLELVSQLSAVECGLASLAMVLRYHGRHVPLRDLRRDVGAMGSGVTLAQLAKAATKHGLHARAYQVDVEGLGDLGPATILHWNMDHFVVLGRKRGERYEVLDPAGALFEMSLEQISDHFTGIAMTFERLPEFRALEAQEAPLAPHMRLILERRKELVAAVLCSVVLQALGLSVPIAIAVTVEDVIPWGDISQLWIVASGIVVAAVAKLWGSIVRGRILTALDVQLESTMRSRFLFHLMHLPYDFHLSMSSGDVLQRVNSQGRIREAISGLALSTALDAGAAVVFFVALVWMSPSLASVVLIIAVVHAGFTRLTRRTRERLMTEYLTADAICQTRQLELINNVQSIKAMGREQAMLQRWSAPFVDVLTVERRQGNFEAVLDAVSPSVAMLVPAVVIGFAGTQVVSGQMTLGGMFASIALAPAFMAPMSSVIGAFERLAAAKSVAVRVNDVLVEESELPKAGVQPPVIDSAGAIEFRNVDFAYNEARPILRDFNLRIGPGETVAIVGPTGSGKSTVAKLLLAMHSPTRGEVTVDGVSLHDADRLEYRAKLGVVPQEIQLLSASFRANIAFGADVDDEQIIRATRTAMIHERILEEPNGYDTPIAEGGTSLSGGERQRLALARALVSEPNIIVMDEATSALDAQTEGLVHQRLRENGATKLVIAHRLSTIRDADIIVVMDRGQVVEQGSHDELMALDGRYARLVASQVANDEGKQLAC